MSFLGQHPSYGGNQPHHHRVEGGIQLPFKYVAGGTLPTNWTFSRASSATYWDASGNVVTVGPNTCRTAHYINGIPHLLLDGYTTTQNNTALWSEDLTNAAWTKLGATPTTIGGSVTPPVIGAANTKCGIIGGNGAFTDQGVVNAAAYTWNNSSYESWSCHAKAGNKNVLRVQMTDKAGTVTTSWINVATGTPGTTAGTHTVKCYPLSNGFYKVQVLLSTSGSGGTGPTVSFCPVDADASNTLTGDGATVNAYVWGIMMDGQGYPAVRSYISQTNTPTPMANEALVAPVGFVSQPWTFYMKITELNGIRVGGNIIYFGKGGTLDIADISLSGGYEADLRNNGSDGFGNSVGFGLSTIGDTVEIRATYDAAYRATAYVTVNGGGENAAALGAVAPQPYSAKPYATMNVGFDGNSTVNCPLAIQQMKATTGVQSLATMRAL